MLTRPPAAMGGDVPLVHHSHQAAAGIAAFFHADQRRGEVAAHSHRAIQVSVVMSPRRKGGRPGDTRVEIIPSHVRHSSHWGPDKEILAIHLDPDFVAKSFRLEFDENDVELCARSELADPFIADCGLLLRREFLIHGRPPALLLESLGTALSARLLEAYGARRPDSVAARTLSLQQLTRVSEIVQDRLHENITVADLSSLVGVSRWHFSRMFKATTGVSPYQFLIRTRVERAREMLGVGVGIAQAAQMTGFADQSHFNRHFKRVFGATPGAIIAPDRPSKPPRRSPAGGRA